MPGKFFSSLIDKQAVSIQRFGGFSVFGDIQFDKLRGFRPELDQAIAISFTQDGQRFILIFS